MVCAAQRLLLHTMSSPGRAYQVVHKSQMSAFEVVEAFFIICALASPSAIVLLPRQSMYVINYVRKANGSSSAKAPYV